MFYLFNFVILKNFNLKKNKKFISLIFFNSYLLFKYISIYIKFVLHIHICKFKLYYLKNVFFLIHFINLKID